MRLRAREFRYAIDLHDGGPLRTEEGTPLETDPDWTPEHLLLAALVRCTLKSLAHHATKDGFTVAHSSGSARALFTKRESDERYAVVECEVELEVRLAPEPGPDQLAELQAKAERDCFIGASLTSPPTYVWR
jgi:organic hydroperoxide reductase OsmC/OhrA